MCLFFLLMTPPQYSQRCSLPFLEVDMRLESSLLYLVEESIDLVQFSLWDKSYFSLLICIGNTIPEDEGPNSQHSS